MDRLVETLKRDGVLKTPRIIQAFLACDRKEFVPEEYESEAYVDAPLPIGEEQTISQPYTVAFMLELLQPESGHKVLDVGFGSGWTTALLAHIVEKKGKVYAMEIVPKLFESGKANVAKSGIANVEFLLGSGWEGWKEKAPFDRILVSAAAPREPAKLKDQLKVGGRMVIPVGGGGVEVEESARWVSEWRRLVPFTQSVRLLVKKSEDNFQEEDHPGFAFVPLVR